MPLPLNLRRAMRNPASSLLVILLAALVVASNSSLFGVLWTLGAKPLPYVADEQLVELRLDLRDIDFQVGLAPRLHKALALNDSSFADVIGFPSQSMSVRDDQNRKWTLQRISADFSQVLGVEPILGNGFGVTGGTTSSGAVPLLISHARWQQRFNADADIVGRELRIAETDYEIVGVMPAVFGFPSTQIQGWTPYLPSEAEIAQDARGAFGDYTVVARMARATQIADARSALLRAMRADPALVKLDPTGDRAMPDVRTWREKLAGAHGRTLRMLQLAAILLLGVVCASVANLGLDQALARRREFATRLAIGGTAAHLRASLLGASLPTVILGCALGVALIPAFFSLLSARDLLPENWPVAATMDLATVLVAVLASALLLASSVSMSLGGRVVEWVGAAGQRALSGALGRTRVVMLVAQISVTLALVGCAGLLLGSAARLLAIAPGFDAQGVLLTAVDLSGTTNTFSAARLAQSVRDEISALPGVRAVALADMPPFSGAEFISDVRVPGVAETQLIALASVTPGYFAAIGTQILAGRDFQAEDAGAASPVLIDRLFQQRWFPNRDPLQSSIDLIDADGSPSATRVIGVVETVKQQSLDEGTRRPMMYRLLGDPGSSFFITTRTDASAATLARPVDAILHRLAPGAVLAFNQPLTQRVDQTLASRRAMVEAVSLFGLLTLLIATLSLYAVLSVAVRRRAAELGLRQALGARRSELLKLVLSEGLRLLLFAIPPGVIAGMLLATQFEDHLYQTESNDPTVWLICAAVLALATLFASCIPAARAMRIAPARVLRSG